MKNRRCSMTLNEAAERIWEERWKFNKDGKKSLQTFMNTFPYLGGGDRELHTITSEDMMNLRLMLRKTKAPSTVNRHLAAWKTVFRQALRVWGAISEVPFIYMEKEISPRERIVSYEEEMKILEWLQDYSECSDDERSYDSISNKRTFYNFFVLLMDTGARPSELLRLRTQDYSRSTGRLYIAPGKTDDYRYVWLPDRSKQAFVDQASRCRGNLFKFRIEVVSRYLNHIKMRIGIDDPSLIPYSYRHTSATRMVESNVNPFVIQRQLGHKALVTTQRYAKADIQQLKAGMKKVDKNRKKNQGEENGDE